MKSYCVVRLRDGIAVLEGENRTQSMMSSFRLPPGTKEGDWLQVDERGVMTIDHQTTADRRALNKDLLDGLLDRK